MTAGTHDSIPFPGGDDFWVMVERVPSTVLRQFLDHAGPEDDRWSAVVHVVGRRGLRSFRKLLAQYALDESLPVDARAEAADSWSRLLRPGDRTEHGVVSAVEQLRSDDDEALRTFALSAATKLDLPGVDDWAASASASASVSDGERSIAEWWIREGRLPAR
jgi:hypothetical protein